MYMQRLNTERQRRQSNARPEYG